VIKLSYTNNKNLKSTPKSYEVVENVPFYFVKDLEANSDLIENNIVNEKTVKLHNRSLIISVML
jgi:hypothetical protein